MLVKVKDFEKFLDNCKTQMPRGIDAVIVPDKSLEDREFKYFVNIPDAKNIILNSYRTVEPIRMLFYLPRAQVFPYEKKNIKRLLVGVKGCDLRSLRLLDKALINDDFIDPDYKFWRDNTYIISTDCQELGESCHCTVLNGTPWAKHNFDINMTRVDDDFVLEVGSEKGQEILELLKEYMTITEAPVRIRELKDKKRLEMEAKVREQNKEFTIQNYKDLRKYASEKWKKESKDCVGCGACTNSCCSCYCIIVNDETREGEKFIKVRSTDSCQINGYARVAGGDSPRPHMYQRFRNRYLCKFDYMPSQFELMGCEGCGRCIDACPAEIDIRKVVRSLAEG
ncbi:MAG: 4Fe-4S dicluster domain-containing protein [Candidatus Marinimicrobia bacterium]|nr:4Fe-4S dicluster domain-containing protein [Candidatus Neomarinimicrobiota bacterium]